MAKIERELDHLPTRLREQWQVDLQEFGNYFDSTLRGETNKSPQATATKEKEKKKSGKNLRFRPPTGEGLENAARYDMMREEFNVKIQSLIEEVQNTVTLKEFEKKCLHFEERIGVLKGLIPAAVPAAPVVSSVDPSVKADDLQLKNMARRIGMAEEGISHLKATLDNVFSLIEKNSQGRKQTPNYLQLEDDITPINPIIKDVFKKTKPKFESFEGHNFLNIDEIENFDIFEGQSSHRSIRDKEDMFEQTNKPTQPRFKPSTKVSSSTGKIAAQPSRAKNVSSSQVNPLSTAKDLSQHFREEGNSRLKDPKDLKKGKNNKEKIKALLGKQTGSSKKAH